MAKFWRRSVTASSAAEPATASRFLGVDLAWREERAGRPANESGVAVIDAAGRVLDVGWARGVEEIVGWIKTAAGGEPALVFIDGPLVVTNTSGQRSCELQVGQRYGRWQVSANSTNTRSPGQAGVALRRRLEATGWTYSDGTDWPSAATHTMCECFPYTALIGAAEFGYTTERPRYKRQPRRMPVATWRPQRAAASDDLIRRLTALTDADPPLLLDSHPATRALREEPSPLTDTAYKHREDLIDALICAWTAALWNRHGLARCQILGARPSPDGGPAATIIAPARPEQRRAAEATAPRSSAASPVPSQVTR